MLDQRACIMRIYLHTWRAKHVYFFLYKYHTWIDSTNKRETNLTMGQVFSGQKRVRNLERMGGRGVEKRVPRCITSEFDFFVCSIDGTHVKTTHALVSAEHERKVHVAVHVCSCYFFLLLRHEHTMLYYIRVGANIIVGDLSHGEGR